MLKKAHTLYSCIAWSMPCTLTWLHLLRQPGEADVEVADEAAPVQTSLAPPCANSTAPGAPGASTATSASTHGDDGQPPSLRVALMQPDTHLTQLVLNVCAMQLVALVERFNARLPPQLALPPRPLTPLLDLFGTYNRTQGAFPCKLSIYPRVFNTHFHNIWTFRHSMDTGIKFAIFPFKYARVKHLI